MIKLSGSYTGSAYYDANELFNSGISEFSAQVRSVHVKYYNTKFLSEGILDNFDKALKLKKEQLFLYDRTGNLLEERIAATQGVQLVRKFYIYDKYNKLLEIDIYGDDRTLHEKWIFRYDKDGNNTEQHHYLSQFTLPEKWIFTFDDTGKIIEEYKYGSNILLEKWTYRKTDEYTAEQCRYLSDGMPDEKWISAYDTTGRRISASRYHQNGCLFEKYNFIFDNFGNLIEETIENISEPNSSQARYEYIYDNRNNWTCRMEFRNNEPQVMIRRSIKYLNEHRLFSGILKGINFKRNTLFTSGNNH